MTAKEHAEVYRRAAQIVGQLDPRYQAAMSDDGGGFTYNKAQEAAWEAYGVASAVLSALATSYEAEEKP